MSSRDEDSSAGELSYKELDAILSAARTELLEYARRAADPTAALIEIMASGQEGMTGHGETAQPQAPSAQNREPVASLITMRARARSLATVLDLARGRARDLARAAVRRGRTGGRHHSRTQARADDQAAPSTPSAAGPLDRARVGDLLHALDRALVRARAHDLAPAFTRGISEDLDLSLALARDIDDPRACTRDLALAKDVADGLERAFTILMEVLRELDAIQVDASGIDLSRLDLSDLDVLVGVTWTQETKWPPGTAEGIRARSEEIRPMVYRVGGSSEDPAALVTV
jgi:hypothetical protein